MSGTTTRECVIGTRGSALAMRQTELVLAPLRRAHPEIAFKVRTIRTTADRHPGRPLETLPGIGFFIKELELALLSREIDAAVHSMKDLPSASTDGLVVAAVAKREDPRDVLVSRGSLTLDALPPGARVGTSSPRRAAFLRAHRGDLVIVPIRGNVETRVRKVDAGELDAVCLAGAGLRRIGAEQRVTQWLSPDLMLPAPGQGALGVQIRADDVRVRDIAGAVDHAVTRQAVTAERAVLVRLAAGCRLPVAAHADVQGSRLVLRAAVAAPDGSRIVRGAREGSPAQAEALGTSLAEQLLEQGAGLIQIEGTRVRSSMGSDTNKDGPQ